MSEPKPDLPVELYPEFSRREVAVSSGGLVVFALALNILLIAVLAKASPNAGYKIIAKKWDIVRRTPDVDLIVVGDSSGNQGVDPEVVRETLGLSAVNLCTVGDMTVVTDVALLETYLASHPAPKVVVAVHVCDVWDREMTPTALSRIPLSPVKIDRLLPFLHLGVGAQAEIVASRLVPLYSEAESIKQLLRGGRKADESKLIDELGFMHADKAKPKLVERDVEHNLDLLQGRRPVISEWNRRSLLRMVKLSNDNGFRLYVVNSPVYRGLYEQEAFNRYQESIATDVSGVLSGLKQGGYLFQPPRTYAADVMQNADHLTVAGARDFTLALCKQIAQ
jgi:hypothetical protein